MVNSKYKYNPQDFQNILGLSKELSDFYKLLEIYKNKKTDDNLFTLKIHWEDLFFLIKGNGVTGLLHPVLAQEMQNYLEDLIYD